AIKFQPGLFVSACHNVGETRPKHRPLNWEILSLCPRISGCRKRTIPFHAEIFVSAFFSFEFLDPGGKFLEIVIAGYKLSVSIAEPVCAVRALTARKNRRAILERGSYHFRLKVI